MLRTIKTLEHCHILYQVLRLDCCSKANVGFFFACVLFEINKRIMEKNYLLKIQLLLW